MAQFSNHYNNVDQVDGTGSDSKADGVFYAPTGYGQGEVLYKHARLVIPVGDVIVDNEVISMMDFQSGDRILSMEYTANGGAVILSSALLGLYQSTVSVDGPSALVSASCENLFGVAIDFDDAELTLVDTYNLGVTLEHADIGKALWELVNLQDADTFTEDPHETWTLAWTSSALWTITAAVVSADIHVRYVPG